MKHGFDPWVGKIPWRREWLPTPVLLPGEFHGQRSLKGYSPQGCKELYMTERLTLLHWTINLEIFSTHLALHKLLWITARDSTEESLSPDWRTRAQNPIPNFQDFCQTEMMPHICISVVSNIDQEMTVFKRFLAYIHCPFPHMLLIFLKIIISISVDYRVFLWSITDM